MKNEPPTNVLAKVWLDGITIDSLAKPNFSSGRTSYFQIQFLTSTQQLNRQRLSADGILIPNLRQYSVVNCNQPVHQFISASKNRSEVANCCAAILLLCMHGHSQTDIISIKHLSEVAERLLRLIEANWQIILLPYF
jgi:hypothetical protein